jgi:hypothetical protein
MFWVSTVVISMGILLIKLGAVRRCPVPDTRHPAEPPAAETLHPETPGGGIKQVLGECTLCGTDLYEDEDAYGLISGYMLRSMDGFAPSSCAPWEEVICIECRDELDKSLLGIRERMKGKTP